MLTIKTSRIGIGMLGLCLIGFGLLWGLSVIFPITTAGQLSNGNVYTGLLAFLLMYGIEPIYWLLCGFVLAGIYLVIFAQNSESMINKLGIIILSWEVLMLLLYFSTVFAKINMPEILFFTIWLLAGLSGIILPIFLIIYKKVSKLVPVIFILGMIILALGGFMRLFLTM